MNRLAYSLSVKSVASVRGVCTVPFFYRLPSARHPANRFGCPSAGPQESGRQATAARKRISGCLGATQRTRREPGRDTAWGGIRENGVPGVKIRGFPYSNRGKGNSVPLKAVRISRRYEQRIRPETVPAGPRRNSDLSGFACERWKSPKPKTKELRNQDTGASWSSAM